MNVLSKSILIGKSLLRKLAYWSIPPVIQDSYHRISKRWDIRRNLQLCSGNVRFKKNIYDARVLLGTKGVNQTEKEVRVVGYQVDCKNYWIATDRHDLSAENIAAAYKLRWNIESFFGWWKQHLGVYHLIARSQYGLMAQMLGGLITYLLLAIYCHEHHNERVSIARVREQRIKIRNEAAAGFQIPPDLLQQDTFEELYAIS